MPTVDEALTAWDNVETDDPNFKYKTEFLLFWADHYLPAAAGFDFFGPNIRRYHHPFEMRTVDGKKKPLVSVGSEAFGILLLENCTDKWNHIVPNKVNDHDWKVPLYKQKDETTHKYHKTKYSDKHAGQVAGGGWSSSAFTRLNELQQAVLKSRKVDAKAGYPVAKLSLQLIRDTYKVSSLDHSTKRKRRKANPAPCKAVDVVEIEEIEDDYRLVTAVLHLTLCSICSLTFSSRSVGTDTPDAEVDDDATVGELD